MEASERAVAAARAVFGSARRTAKSWGRAEEGRREEVWRGARLGWERVERADVGRFCGEPRWECAPWRYDAWDGCERRGDEDFCGEFGALREPPARACPPPRGAGTLCYFSTRGTKTSVAECMRRLYPKRRRQ